MIPLEEAIRDVRIDLDDLPDPETARPEELAAVRRTRHNSDSGGTQASSSRSGVWIVETPLGSAVLARSIGYRAWFVTQARVVPENLEDYKGCLFATGGVDPKIALHRIYEDGAYVKRGALTETRRELVQIVREAVRRRIREVQKESER